MTNLVLIGSSTGGPRVLQSMFTRTPALNAAVVVVQHVPPGFDNSLAEMIGRWSNMKVVVADSGMPLERGKIYIAPAMRHLTLADNCRCFLTDGDRVNYVKPSVDVTMLSVRKHPNGKLAGVILTGMGRDGAAGLAHIKDMGGITFAQDEASCVVCHMPKSAVNTGKVDHVLEPAEIMRKLAGIVGEIGH